MQCETGVENLCIDALDGHWWGIPLQLAILVFAFLGLARVADNYLVTSLETLCVRLHVREDVAGASFMAFGSAAPEIIVNAISTVKSAPQDTNLGIGAILGSGMIAFTVIPGACAMFSKQTLQLKRRPLLRDLVFYSASLLALSWAVSDGRVTLVEATCMLVAYVLYMIVVVSSSHVRSYYRVNVLGLSPPPQRSFVQSSSTVTLEVPPVPPRTSQGEPDEMATLITAVEDQGTPSIATASWATGAVTESTSSENLVQPMASLPPASQPAALRVAPDGVEEAEEARAILSDERMDDDEETWTMAMPLELEPPTAEARYEDPPLQAKLARVLTIAAAPLDALFAWTCPDCAHDGPSAHWYPVTFIVSFLWVSFFSMIISAVVGHWGRLSHAPESFLGLAIVALGAEIPDTIQSVTVARRGYGSMAVSNSLGSQIINILIGLGLPWTISSAFGRNITISIVSHIRVMALLQSLNVLGLAVILLGAAVVYNQRKATLTRAKGAALIGMYLCAVASYAGVVFTWDRPV